MPQQPARPDDAQLAVGSTDAAKRKPRNAPPRTSIVVIAFNQQAQIENALNSVMEQTSGDFEAIVVDDHSSDSTLNVINDTVSNDARFRVIERADNGGAHLARRTGVAATRGEYVLFLDGDDTLDPDAVKKLALAMDNRDADILRFGLTALPADYKSEQLAKQVEHNLNVSVGKQTGANVLKSVFSSEQHERATWSVVDCIYRGTMARTAFTQMTGASLGRLEDAYEFFVLAHYAQSMDYMMDYHALNYTFGTGISAAGSATAAKFGASLKGMRNTLNAVLEFARGKEDPDTKACARDFAHYVHDLLADNWSARLSLEEAQEVFPRIRDEWGDAVAGYAATYAWSKRVVFLDENMLSLRQVDADGALAVWEGYLQMCGDAVLKKDGGNPEIPERQVKPVAASREVAEADRAAAMIAEGARPLAARDLEWMRAVDAQVENARSEALKLRILQAGKREAKRKISQAERANSMKARVRSKGKSLLLKAVDVARQH